jgi:hypothetical protein
MYRIHRLSPIISASYDTDAQAFFTAAGITDSTQKSAVNQLVLDFKSASIWTKMIAIYPFVGGTATTHKYNLKDPQDTDAAHRITFNATHDANGVTSIGSANDLHIIPSSALTLNDTHMSLYSRTTSTNANWWDMGSLNGTGSEYFAMACRRLDAFTSHMYTGSGSSITTVANTDGKGFYLMSRRGGSDCEGYKNGSSVVTNSGASSGALPSLTMYLGCLNFNGTVSSAVGRNYAFVSVGSGLNDTEASALYTAVQAFQTTLSRNV